MADPFSAPNVELLEGRVRAIVEELLSEVGREMDVITDLAVPLPVMVIADMLGLPKGDLWKFKEWSDDLVGVGGRDSMGELLEYLQRRIEERRASPRRDLISALLGSVVEGEKLTDRELLGFLVLLLVAGNETTTNLIGNSVLTMLERKDVVGRLAADPRLVTTAVEEFLRYRSPVQGVFRVAKEDMKVGGVEVKEGDMVFAWIGSANRDEEKFQDPDQFVPDRRPNPHLAFGAGVHTCLGAPLARLEGRLALTALLRLLPRMKLSEQKLEPIGNWIFLGVRHLRVELSS
ncbi:hypothetical protein HS1genome_1791 [Sulfodiicoccus acidiphilus]|uniref:Cytochrome P450 n=1 Tax=Sulfodiicoccus acidiphilus TaxID=1670455 RepID=A0A348B5F0_9CREN|nr:hypothetical protein HS1genome_1791 [Sulfodiicoccus acidiphilus]